MVVLDNSCGRYVLGMCVVPVIFHKRYAHYDNNPTFSDFVPFGGWSKPAIKQYVGDATLCGMT